MRYLHTMLRVVDLEKSIRFYTDCLGLTLKKRKDYPEGKFTLAFLGNESDEEGFLELTYNWETQHYDKGNAYGHMAFHAPNIYKACEQIQALGGKIVRPPGPMKHGATMIAFVEDPDGYKVELIQR